MQQQQQQQIFACPAELRAALIKHFESQSIGDHLGIYLALQQMELLQQEGAPQQQRPTVVKTTESTIPAAAAAAAGISAVTGPKEDGEA